MATGAAVSLLDAIVDLVCDRGVIAGHWRDTERRDARGGHRDG